MNLKENDFSINFLAYPPIPPNIASFKAFQYKGADVFGTENKEAVAIGACSKEDREEYEPFWSERITKEWFDAF